MPKAKRLPARGGPNDGARRDPIDVQVGRRIRLRRHMLGVSQGKLAEALGLTFQQVQKYERGANRVGASRLWELSRVLDVPVEFFFDTLDPVRAPAMPGGFAERSVEAVERDPMSKQETIELVEAYYRVEDLTVRHRLLDLLKALGGTKQPLPGPNRPGRKRRGAISCLTA